MTDKFAPGAQGTDWQGLMDRTEQLYDAFCEAKTADETPAEKQVNSTIAICCDALDGIEYILEDKGAVFPEPKED